MRTRSFRDPVGVAGPAWADDWADCVLQQTDPDRVIHGCTTVIKAGRWSGKNVGLANISGQDNSRDNLAHAYISRGTGYVDRGDYGSAIADFGAAIGLR